jgi:polar amino acid transport system substrate-binding protein
MMKPGTNECVGKAIDITRTILKTSGYQLKIICAPAARIYKMMEQGKVDFTINVKSTRQLQPHTTFIEPLFTVLNLQLYSYAQKEPLTIAAIRGFDYLGHRQRLETKGYIFSDLATAEDAITMFIRGRTRALITYERPFNNYLKHALNNKLPDGISVSNLQSIGTYYGISKRSPIHDEIMNFFTSYISENQITEFFPLN